MSTTITRYHLGVPSRGGALHIVPVGRTWYRGLRGSAMCSSPVDVLELEYDGPDPMLCRRCARSFARVRPDLARPTGPADNLTDEEVTGYADDWRRQHPGEPEPWLEPSTEAPWPTHCWCGRPGRGPAHDLDHPALRLERPTA